MTEIRPPTSILIGDTPHGRGVIAATDIAKGETIEVCPVLELTSDEANGVLTDYIVGLGDDVDGSALMLGYGSLYNHSEDPNAEYIHESDEAYSFTALRDIPAGEQITISYGKDWWESRGDKGA